MSLKAKIEAVIYASEDPVTLVQLMGLLGHEAQAELDVLDAAQHNLALEAGGEVTFISERRGGEDAGDHEALSEETLAGADEAEPVSATATDKGAEAEESPAAGVSAAATAREEKERQRRLRGHFRLVLDQLIAEYANSDRGLEVREVAGGFRFATKPEYHDAVRGFVKSLKPPLKLSLQALETLAVVAYKQPVTAPEVSEIRGVDSGGVLGSLMARKLVTTAGRKHVIGRPILYKTTKDFLLRFGLKDLAELPSIEEFEKMAGQLADVDPVQEEIPMEDEGSGSRAQGSEDEAGSHEKRAEDSVEAGVDKASVDGRMSGLPPDYKDEADDPSAQEAEIQRDQAGS